MPRSSTPADRSHQAFTMQAMLPSVNLTTSAPHLYHSRGSITRPADPLCTLRSRDHSRSTQHSVPAGGQPLPGQDSHLLDRTEGFRHIYPSTWLPPSPSFAWRNKSLIYRGRLGGSGCFKTLFPHVNTASLTRVFLPTKEERNSTHKNFELHNNYV